MLVRTWRNGNPCALLVGMENGAVAMENSMAVPKKKTKKDKQKTKLNIELACDPEILFLGSYSKELKAGTPIDI